eukprot:jgi/Tetstr1/461348/TSEL_006474.t1
MAVNARAAVVDFFELNTPEDDGKVWAGRWPWFSGRYQLGEVVGRGSYGVVHECIDAATGRELAVKVLSKRGDTEQTAAQLAAGVENEVRVLQEVKGCVYCVRLVDVTQDADHVYIVMEHIRGDPLQERLSATGRLSEAEAASAAHDILSLLTHLHARGIMHGDLKPSNFIHCRQPSAGVAPGGPPASLWPARNLLKAIDCGCSRYVAESPAEGATCAGTPLYAAPEVFLRRACCGSDVWSAGMMLAEMLTGRLPFWETSSLAAGLSAHEVLTPILKGPITLEGPHWEGVSADAKDLLARMLARDPEARISAAEALDHRWIAERAGTSCFLDVPRPHCVLASREEVSVSKLEEPEIELILPFD